METEELKTQTGFCICSDFLWIGPPPKVEFYVLRLFSKKGREAETVRERAFIRILKTSTTNQL